MSPTNSSLPTASGRDRDFLDSRERVKEPQISERRSEVMIEKGRAEILCKKYRVLIRNHINYIEECNIQCTYRDRHIIM
jgi:hypothetical protein